MQRFSKSPREHRKKLKLQPSLSPQPTTTHTRSYFKHYQTLHRNRAARGHAPKVRQLRTKPSQAGERGGGGGPRRQGHRGGGGAARSRGGKRHSGTSQGPPAGRPQPGPRHRARFTLSSQKLQGNPRQEPASSRAGRGQHLPRPSAPRQRLSRGFAP